MPGYTLTPEDLILQEVYMDWVCANTVTDLHGDIRDDTNWQGWWRDLAVMPSQRYDAPIGKVGQRFVVALLEYMREVKDRRWKLERFILFQTVILQQARHVTASQKNMLDD